MLETLNFYMTDLSQVNFKDLELIATKCKSLVSVKIGDCEILDLVGFFRAAVSLQEFGGGCFNDQAGGYGDVAYPPRLCRLGLNYMSSSEMPIVFPFASRLKKLDLLYALLDTEDHCLLLQRCPNLEVLEVKKTKILFVFVFVFVFVFYFSWKTQLQSHDKDGNFFKKINKVVTTLSCI